MDFYKRVETVCRQIPYGKAATYGQIALLCGKPDNSRQVGYALSHRMVTDVPAHRIVNSKGYLSGAKSFEKPHTQKKCLEAEGIPVSADNRVDLKTYGWKNTLEDALFLSAVFDKESI